MRRYEVIDEANRIITLADAMESQFVPNRDQTIRDQLRGNPTHYRDIIADTIDDISRRNAGTSEIREQEGMARRAAKYGSDFLDHDHSMNH